MVVSPGGASSKAIDESPTADKAAAQQSSQTPTRSRTKDGNTQSGKKSGGKNSLDVVSPEKADHDGAGAQSSPEKKKKKHDIPEEVMRRGPEATRVHEIMADFADDWEKQQIKKREVALKVTKPDTAIGQSVMAVTHATATAMQVFSPTKSGKPQESLAQQTMKVKPVEPPHLKNALHTQQMQNTAAYKIFSKMYMCFFFWFCIATAWLMYSGQQYFNSTLPDLRDIYFLHGGAARIEAAFDGYVQGKLMVPVESLAHGISLGALRNPFDFFSLQIVVLAGLSGVPELSMLQMAYFVPNKTQDLSLTRGGMRFRRIGTYDMLQFESDLYPSCIAEPFACNRNLSIANADWHQRLMQVDLTKERLEKHNVFRLSADPLTAVRAFDAPIMLPGLQMMGLEAALEGATPGEQRARARRRTTTSGESSTGASDQSRDHTISTSSSEQIAASHGDGGTRTVEDKEQHQRADRRVLNDHTLANRDSSMVPPMSANNIHHEDMVNNSALELNKMPFEMYAGILPLRDDQTPETTAPPAGSEEEDAQRISPNTGAGPAGPERSSYFCPPGHYPDLLSVVAVLGEEYILEQAKNGSSTTGIALPLELRNYEYRQQYQALRAQVKDLECKSCPQKCGSLEQLAKSSSNLTNSTNHPALWYTQTAQRLQNQQLVTPSVSAPGVVCLPYQANHFAYRNAHNLVERGLSGQQQGGVTTTLHDFFSTTTSTTTAPFLSDQFDRGIYTEWELKLPERSSPGDTQVNIDSQQVDTIQTISLLFKLDASQMHRQEVEGLTEQDRVFLHGKLTLEIEKLKDSLVDPHFLPGDYQGFLVADDGTILVDLSLKNTGVIEFQKIWEMASFSAVTSAQQLQGIKDHLFLDTVIVKRLQGNRLQNRFFVIFYADSDGLADGWVYACAVGGICLGVLPYSIVVCIAVYLMYQDRKRVQKEKQQASALVEAQTTLTAVKAVTAGRTDLSATQGSGGSMGLTART
ncbi:unnamed protein product [Amoebophrya sp. A120]|nr:unnamed protein product [Amoebophrya sp. A120]|eukprot:GSA120T00023413001.1